jgi:Mannosylglycerate hydrolase MGH1-like glycoside hydrolase domain
MYNDSAGLFEPIVRPKPKQTPARTWAALAPLALPDLPEPIGRRLIEDHLLDDREFWLPVPPPSVPPTEPSFSLRNDHHLWIRRYWRGPTWINAAWLVWLGLTRLGYHPQSQTLATRIMSAVLAEGLREYYDPYTGGGMGQVDFAWSSLVMEMFAADPLAAAGSYLSLPAGTD